MTIAISLKVNDGVILGSDSASTLIDQGGEVRNVYNHANKVFNLRKGLPIGAITWGSGAIGAVAISTLAKDLRKRFTGPEASHEAWSLEGVTYSIQGVAQRLREFIFDERYTPAFASAQPKPELGFIIAGFSAGSEMAEEFELQIDNAGQCHGPTPLRPADECGIT